MSTRIHAAALHTPPIDFWDIKTDWHSCSHVVSFIITDWKYSQRRAFRCSGPLSHLRLCLQTTKNSGTFYWSNVRKRTTSVAVVLLLVFYSFFSLIICSNQWRKSHTGDTNVCPEAPADPRHADPLALPRPHARPVQGAAPFPKPLQMPAAAAVHSGEDLAFRESSAVFPSVAEATVAAALLFFHRSPQFASAYCTMTGYYCNADFLSNPPPTILASLLFSFLTLVLCFYFHFCS